MYSITIYYQQNFNKQCIEYLKRFFRQPKQSQIFKRLSTLRNEIYQTIFHKQLIFKSQEQLFAKQKLLNRN
ncbi:hypothetical protein pb186bvf_016273 [Paramecium bursaria]